MHDNDVITLYIAIGCQSLSFCLSSAAEMVYRFFSNSRATFCFFFMSVYVETLSYTEWFCVLSCIHSFYLLSD